MVQAALYLDECSQRCYSPVWAYDYMVRMPLWSYGKARALTANPSSHRMYCALPQFPFLSGWRYHCYVRGDGSVPVPTSPFNEAWAFTLNATKTQVSKYLWAESSSEVRRDPRLHLPFFLKINGSQDQPARAEDKGDKW